MDEESAVAVEMDMDSLAAFREKFPVLKDGDVWKW
jgi:hypothetical protein